jgi:hypothetical protein
MENHSTRRGQRGVIFNFQKKERLSTSALGSKRDETPWQRMRNSTCIHDIGDKYPEKLMIPYFINRYGLSSEKN